MDFGAGAQFQADRIIEMNAQEHATTGYSPPQKLRRSSRPAEKAQQQVDDLADQYRSAALEIIKLPEYIELTEGVKSAVLKQFVHPPAGATQAQQSLMDTLKLPLNRTVEMPRPSEAAGVAPSKWTPPSWRTSRRT